MAQDAGLSALIDSLQARVETLETTSRSAPTHTQVQQLTRQVQTLQGGTGNLEPLSAVSGWDLTAGFTDPNLAGGATFVGQGQMLLAGSGITFSRPAHTQFLQIDASGGTCYDYIVCADGCGTHTTVRLMMADFIAEAAAASGIVRSAWLCDDDSDSNIEWGSSTASVGTATLSIECSSTGHFLFSATEDSSRHTLTASGTTANDGYFKTVLQYIPRLIFRNVRLVTSAAAGTTVSFIERTGVGSGMAPELLFQKCEFQMGTQLAFNHALVSAFVASSTGDGANIRLVDCTGKVDGVFRFGHGAITGVIDLDRCTMTMWNLMTSNWTATLSLVGVHRSTITVQDYLIYNERGSTCTYILNDLVIRQNGSNSWFIFFSGQIGGDTQIFMEGIKCSQSSTTIVAVLADAPTTGSGVHSFYMDSCEFRCDGSNSGAAVEVTNGDGTPGWTSAFIGDVTAVNFASVTTGVAVTIAPLNMRIPGYLRVGSSSAPTNTTAGDVTMVRLIVGDAALTAGVEAQITGDTTVSGYLRVGSVAAPTNTTAGDLTAKRLIVGTDAAIPSGVDFYVPTNAARFTGAISNTAITVTRVDVGIQSATPRIVFEHASTTTVWSIYNATGVFLFDAGSTSVLRLASDNMRTVGYLRVGSLSTPTSTTAGDLTLVRLLVGDGASTARVTFSSSSAANIVGTFTGPTGAAIRWLSLEMTSGFAAGDSAAGGIYIRTATTFVDTTFAIGLQNNGWSDALYINNSGATTGATTPTGIGMDVNKLEASAAENNTGYVGFGIQIKNWSAAGGASGGTLLKLINILDNASKQIHSRTDANAFIIQPNDDNNLTNTILALYKADGTTGRFRVFKGGSLSLSSATATGVTTSGQILFSDAEITDTSASTKVYVGLTPTISVGASNVTAEYRNLNFLMTTVGADSGNLSNAIGVQNFRIDFRHRSSGTVTRAVGIEITGGPDGLTAAGNGTLTTIDGIEIQYTARNSTTSTTTTSRGIAILNASLGAGPAVLTNQIGIDIAQLTGAGTLNLGLRNSASSAFPASTEQSIAVSAAIVVNATVVQVSTTTAANMTATPTIADGSTGQIVIIVNTGANTFTLQDQGSLAGSNLRLSAAGVALATRDSIILMYSVSTGDWIEIGQTNVI